MIKFRLEVNDKQGRLCMRFSNLKSLNEIADVGVHYANEMDIPFAQFNVVAMESEDQINFIDIDSKPLSHPSFVEIIRPYIFKVIGGNLITVLGEKQ